VPDMAVSQKFRSFRGNEMIAAARAAWVTQITPELEREGGLALKAHGALLCRSSWTIELQCGRAATAR
jgi:hypothetical protein